MPLPADLAMLPDTLIPVNEADDFLSAKGGSNVLRMASVVIILYPRDGQINLLLTRRSDSLINHPGQINLPGGSREPDDATLWETALRETREEVGMRTGRLQLLGRLESVELRMREILVVPFVAWNPIPPRLRADPTEVSEIIEIPLQFLVDPERVQEGLWTLRGSLWRVGYFRFGEWQVWGLTARMLGDLAHRMLGGHPHPSIEPGSVVPAATRQGKT